MCEEERNIKAEISFYHQVKPLDGMGMEDATIMRHDALNEVLKYLPFIPIGHADGYRLKDPKGRLRLFEERGKRCEICCSDLNGKPFELHHTNYYKAEDPQYQKILCPPCHDNIRYVHGLVKIFEDKLKILRTPPVPEIEYPIRKTSKIKDIYEE